MIAYLEIFKPFGYFLRIKKNQGNSGKFKVTKRSFWSLREDFLAQRVATLVVAYCLSYEKGLPDFIVFKSIYITKFSNI